MDAVVFQVGLALLVIAVAFLGPVIALILLGQRKKRARAMRRSPIGKQLLRSPGHSLRDQIEDEMHEVQTGVLLLVLVPLITLSLFLAQDDSRSIGDRWLMALLFATGVLAFIGYSVRRMLQSGHKLDRLRAGYDAEVAVGQELDQLMRLGAFVFHDFPAEGFNIDHVVIAPQGVFAVETKGYTKPKGVRGKLAAKVSYDGNALLFPGRTTSEPLEQAERQAKWLADWLRRAIGDDVSVLPVVALPGWFVDRKTRNGVRVYNGKELAGLLHAIGTTRISAQDVQRIAFQVEQRCRNVAPAYGEED